MFLISLKKTTFSATCRGVLAISGRAGSFKYFRKLCNAYCLETGAKIV
jgi:hypothetical protein